MYRVERIGFPRIWKIRYKPVVEIYGRTFKTRSTYEDEGLATTQARMMFDILSEMPSYEIVADWLDTVGWEERQ